MAENKIILLTGVSGQMGREACKALKEEGFIIIGLDHIKPDFELDDFFLLDLRDSLAIKQVMEQVFLKYKKLDVLISMAGLKTFKPLKDIALEELTDTLSVNLIAPILLSKQFMKLNENPSGIIINISSHAGFKGYSGSTAYGSSKAGLLNFTETFNDEYSAARMYSLCPSTLYTPEIEEKYGKVDPRKYISPKQLTEKILQLIQGKEKRMIVPLLSFKQKLKLIIPGVLNKTTWLLKK